MAKRDEYGIKDTAVDDIHGVLKNKLGITNKDDLQVAETRHLVIAYEKAASEYAGDYSFTEKDFCYLNKLFLGEIYDWAGTYRTVDLSAEDIRFCHAAYIPESMKTFAKELAKLSPFTPDLSKQEIVNRLAKIHGEAIIIHPFRDGNGRTTRLLCDLLLMQADYKPIRRDRFYEESFVKKYYQAIQKIWHLVDYSPLASLLSPLLRK